MPDKDAAELAGTGVKTGRDGVSACILVSTGSELLLYDAEIRLLLRQTVEGVPCTNIQRFVEGGRRRAMCFFEDGAVSVLRCGR